MTSVNIKLSFNISIHAPASGATVNILKQNPNKVYFNPRSREWSDQESTDRVKCRTYFNPRSREWSDDIYAALSTQGIDFNPRSREWSDCINL